MASTFESSALYRRLIGRVSINLLANLLQSALGIALIPLATFVLGPSDYGVYGLAVAFVVLVVAACETGGGYVLYGHYLSLDAAARASLLSTLLVFALSLGLAAGTVVLLVWDVLVRYIPLLSELSPAEAWLLCLTIPLRTVWSIMNPILIVIQRSEWLAGGLVLQSVVNFFVVLACLFLFENGRAALFWGQVAGLMACLVLAVVLLRNAILAPIRWQWLRQVRRVALGAWFSGLVDSARSTLEGALIASAVSSYALGNYNHARVYQGLMTQGTNAFANVLWPVALREAESDDRNFVQIRPFWDLVYACLACAGIGAVFLGNDVVSLLTHGKFPLAGAWLPWLLIYVLIQNAGKPATAVIYAAQKGNLYSGIRIFTVSLAMLALIALIPKYGVEAVLVVAISEMVMTRVLLALMARRISVVPFQDHWVVAGCLLTVLCWWIESNLDLSLVARCGLVFGLSFIVILILFLFLRMRLGRDWRRVFFMVARL